MKIKDMPSWVLKYKTKGYTVRHNNGSFSLIKISSVRVKDKPYPKLINEFVGVITKDGLIPKKTYNNNLNDDSFIEFGLSHFIYLNFRRDLKRAIYVEQPQAKNLILAAAITLYIFGDINNTYLNYSYLKTLLNVDSFDLLTERRLKIVCKLNELIDEYFKRVISNIVDRNLLIYKLRNTVINKESSVILGLYSKETIEIIERYGLKYE